MARKRPDRPKKGRKVRVDFRKNRGKAARDKSQWTRSLRDDTNKAQDADKSELVRAKGALSRKRTIIENDTDWDTLIQGTVVHMRGLIAEVDDGENIWACTVRRVLRTRQIDQRHPVTVGDWVGLTPVVAAGEQSMLVSDDREMPEGVIEAIRDRRTVLERVYGRRTHVIAANVDTGVITVAADQPTLRPHLIDRYLVSLHQGGMRPIICINKIDLDVDGFALDVAQRYRDLKYITLTTSIVRNEGVAELAALLKDQTTVFVGPSGVGKSSLLNVLDSDLGLRTGSLTDLQRGRHTTTTASLIRWSLGGYVVDTPGTRQFDLPPVESGEIEAYFREFVDRVAACRFPDCTHTHETNCAVKTAVDDGDISVERYESYEKIFWECKEKEDEHSS